jgi:hypothetical protein
MTDWKTSTPSIRPHAALAWRASALAMLVATLSAATALTALIPVPAAAKEAAAARTAEAAAPRSASDPIMAIVSIKSQRVTFYDADGWILRAPVSTGTTGRETPAGVFAVVEKDKDHHSSMYDDAWMPNMLRITWNGLALHGGPLPGYAASHGCVRMPFDFAEKVFDKAPMGMRVIVSPTDTEPVAFSDPALFAPKQDAIDAIPVRAAAATRDADDAAKAAAAAKAAVPAAKRDAAVSLGAVRNLKFLKARADADLARAEKMLAAASANAAKMDQAAVDQAKNDQANTDQLKTDQPNTDRAKMNQAKADQAKAAAQDAEQKASAKVDDLGKQFDAAAADLKGKQDAAAAAAAAAKAAEGKRIETAKAAADAKLAGEPVAIFISRATQKLYVRRDTHKKWPDGGEVYDFSQEYPVTIKDPDRPIGTHIFTAVARDGDGLHWTEVSIDNGDNAKDALGRITFPQAVLDRIAPTAVPLSSITISDEPLSAETNYRTEFVVVLNNQPQGGFITRAVSPSMAANDNGFGSGWFGSSGYAQPSYGQPSYGQSRPSRSYYPQRYW